MQVAELLPEHREGTWLDSTGDYWKFIDGIWHYQKGTYENDWESTDSDEDVKLYGPFERVGHCVGCGQECDGRCGLW